MGFVVTVVSLLHVFLARHPFLFFKSHFGSARGDLPVHGPDEGGGGALLGEHVRTRRRGNSFYLELFLDGFVCVCVFFF